MNINELENKIVKDLAVELTEEFDRNFERKAFFSDSWPATKLTNGRGSMMQRSGNLRRSIRYSVRDNEILYSSSLPYASIHNEGGEIVVTAQMKKFFWAMYYKAADAVTFSVKTKSMAKTKKNQNLSNEAAKWKALALMKVGQKMKIEKRQIIGDHPQVAKIIHNVIDINMEIFNQEQIKLFKK